MKNIFALSVLVLAYSCSFNSSKEQAVEQKVELENEFKSLLTYFGGNDVGKLISKTYDTLFVKGNEDCDLIYLLISNKEKEVFFNQYLDDFPTMYKLPEETNMEFYNRMYDLDSYLNNDDKRINNLVVTNQNNRILIKEIYWAGVGKIDFSQVPRSIENPDCMIIE